MYFYGSQSSAAYLGGGDMNFLPAACFLLGAAMIYSSAPSKAHRFQIGDCISIDLSREAWETPLDILKILVIGDEHYMYHSIGDSVTEDLDQSLSFDYDAYYHKVKCPK